MMIDEEKLKARGWSAHELARVHRVASGSSQKHIVVKKNLNRLSYWTTLLVLTICNIILTFLLAPLILTLQPVYLYPVIFFIAFFFGIIFNILIVDVEHLSTHHHLFAALFIPLVTIADLFIIIPVADTVAQILRIDLSYNPEMVAGVYVAGFLLPFVVYNINRQFRNVKASAHPAQHPKHVHPGKRK